MTSTTAQTQPPKLQHFALQLKDPQIQMLKRWKTLDSSAIWHEDKPKKNKHESIIFHTQTGALFEKAAINFSYLEGDRLPPSALPEDIGHSPAFRVTGISTILHPQNPMLPIAHCNIRYFCTQPCRQLPEPIWWFSAVIDLNPCYGFSEDCIFWHQACRGCCEASGYDEYPKFKQACDDYFYLPHRQEHRGIGGLWIEKLQTPSGQACQNFMLSISQCFMKSYTNIIQRRQPMAYSSHHKYFQNLRRARYAEFNLLYDRGTKFGLEQGGRTESILVSMPPAAQWNYQRYHEARSKEEELLLNQFLTPRDWANLTPDTAKNLSHA